MSAIDRIPYTRGKTNIADALAAARDTMFTDANGDREDNTNVILLITDGQATVKEDRYFTGLAYLTS